MELMAIKTFQQLCRSYFIDHVGDSVSPVTVNAQKVQLNGNVLPLIGSRKLAEITNKDIWDIFALMKQKELSEQYIYQTWQTCKRICDYGISVGVMVNNPFLSYVPKNPANEEFVPFSDSEMAKIREACEKKVWRAPIDGGGV